jgi:hypothetical protein
MRKIGLSLAAVVTRPRLPRKRASGHRRKQEDRRARGDLGVQSAEQPDVVAVDEHVEEARDAVALEHARREAREPLDELPERLADGTPLDADGAVAAGLGPEDGWDPDLRHGSARVYFKKESIASLHVCGIFEDVADLLGGRACRAGGV